MSLPAAFADLEPFAPVWCLKTETERWARRQVSTMPEMQAFYDAFAPCLEEAIVHCDAFPLDGLPEEERNLLLLIYSFAMVSMSIEIFHQPKPVDAADAELERVEEPIP